jgi:hypothetical protein
MMNSGQLGAGPALPFFRTIQQPGTAALEGDSEKKISIVALQHYSIRAAWQPKKGNTVLLTHPNLSHT